MLGNQTTKYKSREVTLNNIEHNSFINNSVLNSNKANEQKTKQGGTNEIKRNRPFEWQ